MPPPCQLLIVQRAADGKTRFVQDVGINHRGGNVLVSKQLLDGTDIVATFKQVRGKAVSERVAAGCFRNTRLLDGEFDGVLEVFLRGVVTAGFPALRIDAQFCRWKHVLPRPGAGSIHVLAVERVRQVNSPATSSKILAMQFVDPRKMGLKGTF